MSKEIARALLSIDAVIVRPDEPFTWASGIKSPVYCDNRLTLTAPAVRTQIETALAETVRIKFPEAEALFGTSTAGIAHAAIVGHLLGLPPERWLGLDFGCGQVTRLDVESWGVVLRWFNR